MDETGSRIYRFEDDTLVELDIGNYPVKGSYLSGNILRCLRPGDGYYDIDLSSGNEVRLNDIQLDGSYAAVLLPNCIIESTLLFPDSLNERQPGMEHSMKLFDGANWYDVLLPNELRFAVSSRFLTPRCVTSDRILLSHYTTETIVVDGNDNEEPTVHVFTDLVLYQICLGKDGYKLEYFTTVKQPRTNTGKE